MTTSLVQQKHVSLTGPQSEIEVTPDSALGEGNLVVMVVEVQDPENNSDAPINSIPVAPVPGANAYVGLGVYPIITNERRSVRVLYGPTQPNSDYLNLTGASGLSAEATIDVFLYEFHSSLGSMLGFPMVDGDTRSTEGTLTQYVSPWYAASTGYAKSGPLVAIGICPPGDTTSSPTLNSGADLNSTDPLAAHLDVRYGERSLGSGDTLSIEAPAPEAESDPTTALLYIQDVVPQSRYEIVQTKRASAQGLQPDDTLTVGNLLLLIGRGPDHAFLDGVEIPDWAHVLEQNVADVGGLTYLTVLWAEITEEVIDIFSEGLGFSVADHFVFYEVSGFDRAPMLAKAVQTTHFGDAFEEGGGSTTMPFSLPDNDGFFFAATAFTQPIDYGLLLPGKTIYTDTPLMVEGAGWDFYPDAGFPVGVVGNAVADDVEVTSAAVIGAIFVNDPDAPLDGEDPDPEPEPEPTEDDTRYTFPDSGDRLYYLPGVRRGSALTSARGNEIFVYSDAAGTTLAPITQTDGTTVITGSKLTVDENSLIPLFRGAPGVTKLWVRTAGETTLTPIYASTHERLVYLSANGGGGGGGTGGGEELLDTHTVTTSPYTPNPMGGLPEEWTNPEDPDSDPITLTWRLADLRDREPGSSYIVGADDLFGGPVGNRAVAVMIDAPSGPEEDLLDVFIVSYVLYVFVNPDGLAISSGGFPVGVLPLNGDANGLLPQPTRISEFAPPVAHVDLRPVYFDVPDQPGFPPPGWFWAAWGETPISPDGPGGDAGSGVALLGEANVFTQMQQVQRAGHTGENGLLDLSLIRSDNNSSSAGGIYSRKLQVISGQTDMMVPIFKVNALDTTDNSGDGPRVAFGFIRQRHEDDSTSWAWAGFNPLDSEDAEPAALLPMRASVPTGSSARPSDVITREFFEENENLAGKSLYSGEYGGADLSFPGGEDYLALAYSGVYVPPLLNVEDSGLDPGWINYTAQTERTRFVLQAVCWTDLTDPPPDPSEAGFGSGNEIRWQIGNGGTGDFPHGNAVGMVVNSDDRSRRQLEIVVFSTPGQNYRYTWSWLGSGFIMVGSRFRLTCNVYSA